MGFIKLDRMKRGRKHSFSLAIRKGTRQLAFSRSVMDVLDGGSIVIEFDPDDFRLRFFVDNENGFAVRRNVSGQGLLCMASLTSKYPVSEGSFECVQQGLAPVFIAQLHRRDAA